ncbi:MAG: LytR C-terminal domain-containing protein [Candidatus Levybacteria bacterium]|nr:LytR C-terminal domain-containing protein [Candidatus Levybacteria bacterium]
MKRKAHVSDTFSSLKILKIFLILLGIIIAFSLIFRAISMIRESSFDGSNPYILAFSSSNTLDFVVASPHEQRLSRLIIKNVKNSVKTIEELGLPWDTFVRVDKPLSEDNGASLLFSNFKGLHQAGNHLTAYDFYRLGFAIKELSSKPVNKATIIYSEKEMVNDEIISKIFLDKTLLSEGKTITIVNASGVSGIGVKLEEVIAHLGGTVIAVENGEKILATSTINYSGEESYTLKRLSKLLDLTPKIHEGKGLSDILITLGKDKSSQLY